jgi:flagellar hook protein FlgE
MNTSVAGLTAQAFALQNISGNIANSQTTAYKAIGTNFNDIVESVGATAQTGLAGSVQAVSVPSNTTQGAVNATGVATNMAINGQGYFQVQQLVGQTDGSETFSGTNVYTRAGDFTMDKQGYLVNGSGAALMAIPIDPSTGNPIGDTAQLLQVSTGYLKANATTQINYQANLPASPTSGVLDPSKFAVNPTNTASAASVTATAAYTSIDFPTPGTDKVTFNITDASSGNVYPITLQGGAAALAAGTASADGTGGYTVSLSQALSQINTQLAGSTVTATSNNGAIVLTSSVTGTTSGITVGPIGGTGTVAEQSAVGFTLAGQTAAGTNPSNYVEAQDNATFQSQSLAGSSTTAYTTDGTAVNVQLRWAKVASSPPTWNLFYQSNSAATGTAQMWTNTGASVIFGPTGALNTPTNGELTISNMNLNGAQLGNVKLNFGTSGLTQYDSAAGTVDVSSLSQNGYTSGSLTTVGVNNQGEVTASYTNGQQVPIAQVPLYKFNGSSALTVQSGGIYVPNDETGAAVKMASTDITGGSLEASNTDIATQFSQMIVTQQAYSANSKIITTANSMMQSVMNIVQ